MTLVFQSEEKHHVPQRKYLFVDCHNQGMCRCNVEHRALHLRLSVSYM